MTTQAEIGNLRVSLSADTAQFIQGLMQAQSSLGRFGGYLKKFAVAAAAGFTFHEMVKSIKEAVDHIDELGHSAQKIGIPVDQLSKLEYAAKLADVSFDTLQTTVEKFSKALAQIQGGASNDAGKALTAMGISAVDAQGKLRPTIDIITDVADEFAAMKDGANKTAIAMALFGKTGADMIPLLNGGKEAIAGASSELENFGGVVTPQAAEQADKLNTNLTRLTEVGDGLKTLIASNLSPVLSDLSGDFLDFIKNSGTVKTIWEGLSWVIQNSIQFLEESVAMWKSLVAYIAATGEAFKAITSGDFDGVSKAFDDAGKVAAEAWSSANKQFLGYVASLNANSGAGTAGKGDYGLPPKKTDGPVLPQGLGGSGRAAKAGTLDDIYGKGFLKSIDEAQKSFAELWDEMSQGMDAVSELDQALQSMTYTLADTLSSAIVGVISGTESLKDAFKSVAQSISQQLEQLAGEILRSEILKLLSMIASSALGGGGSWVGGMYFGGAAGFRAGGGPVSSGKSYVVGEKGPELFTPGASGFITPNDQMGSSGVNISVNNYAGVDVKARQAPDGRVQIDLIKKEIARDIARGGNVVSQSIERGYGLRRSGK